MFGVMDIARVQTFMPIPACERARWKSHRVTLRTAHSRPEHEIELSRFPVFFKKDPSMSGWTYDYV
jgi:hypothetical protein